MAITNNVIQNIINIGNQTGCGQQATCPGYSMYIPCLQNIIQGNDATISFYLLDKSGTTVNTKDIQGFITTIENQFGCQEALGVYGNIDFGDSDSDSDQDIILEIKSEQKEYTAPVVKDNFSDLINDGNKFSSDEYEYIDYCFNDTGCLRLGYKCSQSINNGSTGVLKLKQLTLPNDFTVKLKVKNGTKNQSKCCITVNGKMYIKDLSKNYEEDESDIWDELEYNFDGIDGDVFLDIQSIKINNTCNYAEMKLKSFEVITTDCISDEGLFTIELPSWLTSELVRGDLKLTSTIVDNDGKIFTTNCAIGGKIK